MDVCIYACMHVSMYGCMHVCMCACLHLFQTDFKMVSAWFRNEVHGGFRQKTRLEMFFKAPALTTSVGDDFQIACSKTTGVCVCMYKSISQ